MSEGELPRLEGADLEEALKPLLHADRQHFIFAVYGTGDEQMLRVSGAPDLQVLPVRSELELREKLPPLDDEDPRIVFLVPWTREVPLDLAGRFARDGRVIRIDRKAKLRRIFEVKEVDREAENSPLAEWMLRPNANKRYLGRETRLTRELLWARWLRDDHGVDTEGGFALDVLLAWASRDGRGPAFKEGAGGAQGLRAALLDVLGKAMGPAAELVWRAWEEGRGSMLLQYAVLFEVLANSDNAAVRMWVKERLRSDFQLTDDSALLTVAKTLGDAASSALRYIERRNDRATIRAILRAAEERVADEEIRAALAPSPRLPTAFSARLTALGNALANAATDPSVDRVHEAEDLLRKVETHTIASEKDSERAIERAWMAVRLLAWLAVRTDKRLTIGAAPHAAAAMLGQWYAAEGGYLDWARRVARGTTESAFDRGVGAVVDAVDQARQELDRRFARALVEWYAAGKPASEILPIETALERVAAKFLDEKAERRLLVVLLDGMAWAQAAELLQSLSEREWGALVWHKMKNKLGEGVYPAVLASVPSVTDVSRAAFFASKATTPGKQEDTQKDRDRFRENKIMGRFFTGTDVPTLLLRGESLTKSGAASEEALRLVGDASRRVVAVVVNAIDDSLKGNPTTRHPWGVENIAALADLLNKAREAGRAVLLASDHGHVPSDLLEFKGPVSGGGARWRPLASASDPLQEFEVKFPSGSAWGPKGAWGVALMADETGRWGSSTHSGEHGGATLAEIVAPCVLVGSEDLEGPIDADPALRISAPFVPEWWHLSVRAPVPIPPESVRAVAPPPKPMQLTLLPAPTSAIPAPAARTPVETRAPVSPIASALQKSEILKARAPNADTRVEIVRAVDFLSVRNGSVTASAFASEMNVVMRRVGGKVATLQEVLNVDGYEVLRYDGQAQQVHLDLGKLRTLFEVKE